MNRWLVALFLTMALSLIAHAQSPKSGKNTVVIRGQEQAIYFYPAKGIADSPPRKVFFIPGDGGWRGFAITTAVNMASWGYDVYGLDTRIYLSSFTGKTTLKETEIKSDLAQMAKWMVGNSNERVTLMGWSQGAGMGLLGVASPENKKAFNGLLAFGMPDSAVLGWRWADTVATLAGKDADEPVFQTAPYFVQIAPLPFVMIQASNDGYLSLDAAKKLFAQAKEPRRMAVVEANDHKFSGNTDGFFRELREGLQWISKSAR
jgi:dienelactone hydrolase